MAHSISNTFVGLRATGLSTPITGDLGDQALPEDLGQVESGDTAVLETPSGFSLGANTHAALTTAKDALLDRFYGLTHQLVRGGPALQNVLLAESVAVAALTGTTAALGMFSVVVGNITSDLNDKGGKDVDRPSLGQAVKEAAGDVEHMIGDSAAAVGELASHAVDGAIDTGRIVAATTLPGAAISGAFALGETGAAVMKTAEQAIGGVASDGMKFASESGKAYFDVATIAGSMYCPVGPVFMIGDLAASAIEFFYDPKLPRGNRSAFARLCSRVLAGIRGRIR